MCRRHAVSDSERLVIVTKDVLHVLHTCDVHRRYRGDVFAPGALQHAQQVERQPGEVRWAMYTDQRYDALHAEWRHGGREVAARCCTGDTQWGDGGEQEGWQAARKRVSGRSGREKGVMSWHNLSVAFTHVIYISIYQCVSERDPESRLQGGLLCIHIISFRVPFSTH